jgi:hypothetical protein
MKTRNAMIDLHGILYNTDNRSLLSQLALQKLSMIYKNVPEEMLHHIEGSASAMEMIGCDQSDKQRVRRMIYRIRDANMYDTECNISMPEPVLAIFALIRKHKEFEDRFLRQIHALKEETIENIEDQQVFQDEEFRNKDRDQATLRVLDQIDRIFGSK